jgi:hypothetical protein
MAKRRQPAVKRQPSRKKKRDPTVAIILFVGIGFLALAAGVYFASTQKAPKVAKKESNEPQAVPQPASKPKPPAKPKRPEPKPQRPAPRPGVPKPKPGEIFHPSSLNRLPNAVALPEDEGLLAGDVFFPPQANCRLQLDVPAYGHAHGMKIARGPNSGAWQIAIPAQDTPVAEITLDEDGIYFRWGPACPPQVATLLHNCILTVRAGKHKKKMQLRPIAAAPDIRLFDDDKSSEYTLTIPQAPRNILYTLAAIEPDKPPFHVPQVGAPATRKPRKLSRDLDWSPTNDKRNVIHITQTKEYKIGNADWRPLTPESLREDWEDRLKKFDKVLATFKRKPKPTTYNILLKMAGEGGAFQDLRNFYWVLPERNMHLEFITVCGDSQIVIAQFPAADQILPQYEPSTLAVNNNQRKNNPTKPNSPAQPNDGGWTIPQGANDPWAGRRAALLKLGQGGK